jgi:uncharacterized sporulation protein YeaH/YhbH (DUF444 family)
LTIIIDRRKNSNNKNISNRQRFLRRIKSTIKQAVRDGVKNNTIKDLISDKNKIKVPVKDVSEPTFNRSRKDGKRDIILPGNDIHQEKDRLKKPPSGNGGKGNQGDPNAPDSTDDFYFTLTQDEFLDVLFEDLELPDLIKQKLKSIERIKYSRAGFTTSGAPSNLNVERSIKQSIARKIALNRPSEDEIEELEKELAELEKQLAANPSLLARKQEIEAKLNDLKEQLKTIPFIDEMDIRYNLWTKNPQPIAQAVVFCLLDVSGSMGEKEKELAKKFFFLLQYFLTRNYGKVDIVYLRHTTEASEVEEEEFFYGNLSGGTVVSTVLEKMDEIIKKRYPISDWNIYAAQCSDGDNWGHDNGVCIDLLNEKILPVVQYFSYIQISHGYEASRIWASYGTRPDDLWNTYSQITAKNFAKKKVSNSGEIWTVFRELFAKKGK